MAAALNQLATVPVRAISKSGGNPISNTTAIDTTLRDALIAVFSSIPNQADGTATVAAIVTTLKTLPTA